MATVLLSMASAARATDNRLFIYNWADFIGKSTLQDFTRATGIKVVYDTFDAEETKETKLMAGGSGYDIVVSSSGYSPARSRPVFTCRSTRSS